MDNELSFHEILLKFSKKEPQSSTFSEAFSDQESQANSGGKTKSAAAESKYFSNLFNDNKIKDFLKNNFSFRPDFNPNTKYESSITAKSSKAKEETKPNVLEFSELESAEVCKSYEDLSDLQRDSFKTLNSLSDIEFKPIFGEKFLKAFFKHHAKLFHPDQNQGLTVDQQNHRALKFIELKTHYDILKKLF